MGERGDVAAKVFEVIDFLVWFSDKLFIPSDASWFKNRNSVFSVSTYSPRFPWLFSQPNYREKFWILFFAESPPNKLLFNEGLTFAIRLVENYIIKNQIGWYRNVRSARTQNLTAYGKFRWKLRPAVPGLKIRDKFAIWLVEDYVMKNMIGWF